LRFFGFKKLLARLASIPEDHILGFFLALVLLVFVLIAWDFFHQLAAAP
jgi:hypothetical protein